MTNGEFKVKLERRTVDFSVAVLRTLRKIPVGIESRNINPTFHIRMKTIGFPGGFSEMPSLHMRPVVDSLS